MSANRTICSGEGSSYAQIVPHPTIEGLFICNGNNFLYTKNLVPGVPHTDELLLNVENYDGTKTEYREWNPLTSKLAAAIVSGADNLSVKPGSHVLFLNLGDECGTTVSHISDIVGPDGHVYVVESENQISLVNMAKKRFNISPLLFYPVNVQNYRMLVGSVDVLFAAVFDGGIQPFLANANAQYYLKSGGQYVICVKANCIEPTNQTEAVFDSLGKRRREYNPVKQVSLKPFDEEHGYVIGVFRRKYTT